MITVIKKIVIKEKEGYGLLVNGRDLRHYTKQVKSRAGERFIHEAYSFKHNYDSSQCHFLHIYVYMYVCIYNCLWSELFEVRWQSLAKTS